MKSESEYPLVLLDHEAALQSERIIVSRRIDQSFLSFMFNNGAR